ncbi:MAG: preprotein translocase subunit SecE [candidate division Zixibacteria bacterium]|nr:preprotein translocase subunit SecE [candidate division Zixibacteria bacterium]
MFEKIKIFLKEVKLELTKVTWTSKQELMGSTVVVILLSLILALFIGGVDKVIAVFISFIFR